MMATVMQLQHRHDQRWAQTPVMRFRLMGPYGPARQSALCESGPIEL